MIIYIYISYIYIYIHHIYIYHFSMACELNSCPCMRTSRCSHRLVVRHHASAIQAGSKCHKIKKLRIGFLWAVVQAQPCHAITEAQCKSSRERTRIFLRFGSPKMPLSVTSQQRRGGLDRIVELASFQG